MGKIVRKQPVVDETPETEEYDESVESEAPARQVNTTTRIRGGWGAPREERRETVKAPFLDFKKGDSSKVVAILNEEPVAHWKRHFVRSLNQMFYCYHEDKDRGCPLCDVGHRSSWVYRINTVELNDNVDEVRTWDFSWKTAQALQAMASKRALNDAKRYFDLTHVKGQGVTVIPVGVEALQEDYDMEPLELEQRKALEAKSYGDDTIFINSWDQVAQAARKIDPDQDLSDD